MNSSEQGPANGPPTPDPSTLREVHVLDDAQINLVQESFAKVETGAADAAAIFYGRLFGIAPDLKPLFKGDMTAQGRKLMTMIKTALNGLDDPGALIPALEDLGRRHAGYGVKDANYATFGEAWSWMLEQRLGDDFTLETRGAWSTVYTLIARVMSDAGAKDTEEKASEAEDAAADIEAGAEDQDSGGGTGLEPITNTSEDDMLHEVGTLESGSSDMYRQMVEDMPVNVLICELYEFKITYANKASITSLKQLEHLLPVKADEIVGAGIGIFLDDPRSILGDPDTLPYGAKSQLGGHALEVKVSALRGGDGAYVAAMLAWNVISDRAGVASEVKGLTEMMASSATELRSTAAALAATAEETNTRASAVAADSEQLTASVNEISRRVSRSSSIAGNAVEEAGRSNEMVQEWPTRPTRSARGSNSSPTSPARPTCWPSTPPSRRRAPAKPVRASP